MGLNKIPEVTDVSDPSDAVDLSVDSVAAKTSHSR